MRLASERREAILRAARLRGTVRVSELAERMRVSAVTIRRDVTVLVEEGLLERVHGGAVLARGEGSHSRAKGSRPQPRPRATIGLVVPSAHYYYPKVIRGAEAAASVAGVRLILAVSHYYPAEDRRQVERLVELGVDALLLATSEVPDQAPAVAEWIAGLPVPTVLVERRIDLRYTARVESVHSDHQGGTRLALSHLAGLGHQRVALAVREESPTSRWLIAGHRQCVDSGEIDPDAPGPVLLPTPDADPGERSRVFNELLDDCLRTKTRAILVHTDEDAVELCRVARSRSLAVPADLALVAYDDETAELADVPLTAVAPPKHEVGRAAVEMAMRRLTAGEDPAAQQLSLLPRLDIRSSCGG